MDRDQPPAVNDLAIRGVPGVCRMLAGAEMQKGHPRAAFEIFESTLTIRRISSVRKIITQFSEKVNSSR